MNGQLFFVACDPDHDCGLWKSDGTEAGTVYIPGSSAGGLEYAFSAQGLFYFSYWDGTVGRELWRSDGTQTGTFIVKDIYPGSMKSSDPDSFQLINNELFFSADDGENGRELWKTDGTQAGTVLASDLLPGPTGSLPENIAALPTGGGIFEASDGNGGLEAWKMDANGNLSQYTDIVPGISSSDAGWFGFAVSGSLIYFAADDVTHGMELWAIPLSAPGSVPDGNAVSGTALTASRSGASDVALSWGPSCGIYDDDYEIYVGTIGDFQNYYPATCTTAAQLNATLTGAPNNSFFIVVPRNPAQEGSYGTSSAGVERSASATACVPQDISSCPD